MIIPETEDQKIMRLIRDQDAKEAENLRKGLERIAKEKNECPICGEPLSSYCTNPRCPQD